MKKFVIIVLVIVLMLMATGCGRLHNVQTLDEQIATYISCPKNIFEVFDDSEIDACYISIKVDGHEVGVCYAIADEDGNADLYLGTNMLEKCDFIERELFTEQIEDYFEANNLTLKNIIFVEEYC